MAVPYRCPMFIHFQVRLPDILSLPLSTLAHCGVKGESERVFEFQRPVVVGSSRSSFYFQKILREGRNSAALHALRRQSYGEVAHPPLPPSPSRPQLGATFREGKPKGSYRSGVGMRLGVMT